MLTQVESFPLAAGPLPVSQKASRQDPRVVEHEQIAGIEEVWQIAELAMIKRSVTSANDQQPRPVALGSRLLRDQVVGEVVIEKGHI
jgi:hypothetical protein